MLYKRKLRWRSDDVNHNSFVTLVSIRLPLPCCKLCKLSISLGSFFSKNGRIFIYFLCAQNVVLVGKFEFACFRRPKKYTDHDRLHGKGPYGEMRTKKEPIKCLNLPQTTLPYNKYILLTKRGGSTRRISAQGLKSTDWEYEVST